MKSNNYTIKKAGGHNFGTFERIFTGHPQTEVKDIALRMERKTCPVCMRRTPHKLDICQWHSNPD